MTDTTNDDAKSDDALAKLQAEYDQAVADHDEAIATLTTERDEALEKARTLEAQLEDANAATEAAKAEAAAAAKAGKVTRGKKPPSPRKLKAMADSPDAEKLRDMIANADTVEIAFSDGKTEIAGLAPFDIEGDAWLIKPTGLWLRTPITIHGPAQGEAGYSLDGYALIIDGKQVAYTKRSDVIHVAAGGTFNLADDIYFG